jgi:mannan endo-1,4-beta-mannosidase
MRKRIQILVMLFFCMIAISSCKNIENKEIKEEPIDVVDTVQEDTTEEKTEVVVSEEVNELVGEIGFQVQGTKLLDGNGNSFVMKGLNHAHTWYKGELIRALDTTEKMGANTIRIVLSDGQQWEKDSLESVLLIIEECKKRNLICVLEVHDVTGSNRIEDLEKVIEYWIEIKEALIGNEDYVILNIANEWYGEWKTKTWKEGYLKVIPMIRDAGILNTIMVDSAGWGQYPKSIIEAGKEVLAADPYQNTMFSVHMYEYAGKDAKTISDTMEEILAQDLCLVIGEFGQKHKDGPVAFETILEESIRLDVGYLGWSLKGNSGGVEYLDIALDWDGNTLSTDWGEILVHSPNGIKNTAKLATVFDEN